MKDLNQFSSKLAVNLLCHRPKIFAGCMGWELQGRVVGCGGLVGWGGGVGGGAGGVGWGGVVRWYAQSFSCPTKLQCCWGCVVLSLGLWQQYFLLQVYFVNYNIISGNCCQISILVLPSLSPWWCWPSPCPSSPRPSPVSSSCPVQRRYRLRCGNN